MTFYDKLVNIRGTDIPSCIRESLREVFSYYDGLETSRTCYIYSSNLYEVLRSKGLSCRLISTCDLGFDYEHFFILVLGGKEVFYLVDPTIEQFFVDRVVPDDLAGLVLNKYIKADDDLLNSYFKTIFSLNLLVSLDDVYFKNVK